MPKLATRTLLALASLAFTFASPAARAQTTVFLPQDVFLDSHNRIQGSVITGYANFDDYINGVNRTSPTITMGVHSSVSNDLQLFNGSTLEMNGGSIGSAFGKLLAYDQSIVNIHRGTVMLDAELQHSSTLNLEEGRIGNDLITFDDSTVNMRGGSVGHAIITNHNSTFNLSGGRIQDNVFIQDSSILNIYGVGLRAVLVDPNYQDFYSEYMLFGRFVDGTFLNGKVIFVQNGTGAGFTLNAARRP